MSKLSPGRAMALKVLREARQREAFVSYLIDELIDTSQLSAADKAFATRLVLGVVSCRGTLDEAINRSLNKPSDIKPKVRDALRISAYELVFLGKEAHAVVSQGVELVRSVAAPAAGFANAVLRKIALDVQDFPWGDSSCDEAALARQYAFPLWIVKQLIAEKGWQWTKAYLQLSNQDAPLYFATNTLKTSTQKLCEDLDHEGIAFEWEASCKDSLRILDKAAGVASAVLKDGRALVCDAASQHTAALASSLKDAPYLEVGSGRGTKTILLERNFASKGCVPSRHFALDNLEFKSQVLQQRLDTFGISQVVPLVGDATKMTELMAQGAFGSATTFGGAFLDVPCSGLGTLRRHPEIRWSVKPEDVSELAQLGGAILEAVAPYIQVGGRLVYSTCTIFEEENQRVIDAFLASPEGRDWKLLCAANTEGQHDEGQYDEGQCNEEKGVQQNNYYQGNPLQSNCDLHFAAVLERIQ